MLSKTTLSAITVNTRIRALRTILYFCMEKGYIEKFQIPTIKCDKNIKETYTEHELELLLKKPRLNDGDTFTEYRNWVIINYLLATGNRLSTLCNIKINDLDFHNSVIYLTKTKNRKQQIIPMSATLHCILLEYIKYRSAKSNEDYLFCSSYGERFTERGMESAIKLYNLSRGVTKTSIHLFRHTFAKFWVQNGGDVFKLQKMLGHSTLDMSREYVEMFNDDLKKGFDDINPLDQLARKNSKAGKQVIHIRK